jgi:hypothetical protein
VAGGGAVLGLTSGVGHRTMPNFYVMHRLVVLLCAHIPLQHMRGLGGGVWRGVGELYALVALAGSSHSQTVL